MINAFFLFVHVNAHVNAKKCKIKRFNSFCPNERNQTQPNGSKHAKTKQTFTVLCVQPVKSPVIIMTHKRLNLLPSLVSVTPKCSDLPWPNNCN